MARLLFPVSVSSNVFGERVYTAMRLEYMGNYSQAAGSFRRPRSGSARCSRGSPRATGFYSGPRTRPILHCSQLTLTRSATAAAHHQVLTGALVFGKLFAFVAFIFVYKILITAFIV